MISTHYTTRNTDIFLLTLLAIVIIAVAIRIMILEIRRKRRIEARRALNSYRGHR